MALTADERRDILAYLTDEAETADVEIGLDFIFDHYEQITNPVLMEKKALRREIRVLREQRPLVRAELDVIIARIAAIDAILNP